MSRLEELVDKIEANKQILSTLPTNNVKNINIYLDKVEELQEEFKEIEKDLLKQIEKKYKTAVTLKENEPIKQLKKELEDYESVIYLLNKVDTSYEKMDLDKEIQNLSYYYKKNLGIVNQTISNCITIFSQIGINLTPEDFKYTNYVNEYIKVFFKEYKKNIHSEKIKNKFEEIYWKCPSIITHIELNIRYIFLKNEKEIDRHFAKQKEELLKKYPNKDIIEEYNAKKKELTEKEIEDKNIIIKQFINGELSAKDFTKNNIQGYYQVFFSPEFFNAQENLDELDNNLMKLKNSIYEYQKYLKFKFIIDNVKNIFVEKDKYKAIYQTTIKQISAKEGKILKLNKKINSKGLFGKRKTNEKDANEQEKLIRETKQLYKELDDNKVYNKISNTLKENSTLSDVLYLASSFYKYLFNCIRKEDNELSEEEIDKIIEEVREFEKWPYCTIMNNVTILEEKDIMLIIKDRYQLLNINLEKGDLTQDNLENLLNILKNIEIAHSIRKNNIDVEELGYIYEFKKILNK